MKSRFRQVKPSLVVAVWLTILGICISQNSAEDWVGPDGIEVSKLNADFNMALYEVTKTAASGESFVISPFSLSTVLAMLRVGADGITEQEIQEGLGLRRLNENTINNGYSDILFSLHENIASYVSIGSRIYITNRAEISLPFKQTLARKFFTKVLPTNFARNREVVEDMNAWIEEITNGKISDLIVASDSIKPNTKVLVTNVIYFRGTWEESFNSRDTNRGEFITEKGTRKSVLLMRQEADFRFIQLPEISANAIAMPYEGDRFNLIVILPNLGENLQNVENRLKSFRHDPNTSILGSIFNRMSIKFISLTFPKFSQETEIDFVTSGILSKLGMKAMINSRGADFSRISTGSQLHVDAIAQKCFFDITEVGTEATGATYAKIVPLSLKRATLFSVTRPFTAFVYDRITDTILFVVRKTS